MGLALMGVEREPCLVSFGWLCGVSLPPRREQLVKLPSSPTCTGPAGAVAVWLRMAPTIRLRPWPLVTET